MDLGGASLSRTRIRGSGHLLDPAEGLSSTSGKASQETYVYWALRRFAGNPATPVLTPTIQKHQQKQGSLRILAQSRKV
jgi:hypothetical protein